MQQPITVPDYSSELAFLINMNPTPVGDLDLPHANIL